MVFLLAPLVLAGPVLLLLAALAALWAHGPLGWLAAVLLLVSVGVVLRVLVRWTRAWWRSTKAPVRRAPQARRRHVPE